jgi:hypothetical protein
MGTDTCRLFQGTERFLSWFRYLYGATITDMIRFDLPLETLAIRYQIPLLRKINCFITVMTAAALKGYAWEKNHTISELAYACIEA